VLFDFLCIKFLFNLISNFLFCNFKNSQIFCKNLKLMQLRRITTTQNLAPFRHKFGMRQIPALTFQKSCIISQLDNVTFYEQRWRALNFTNLRPTNCWELHAGGKQLDLFLVGNVLRSVIVCRSFVESVRALQFSA
jgi:hypothetical protein